MRSSISTSKPSACSAALLWGRPCQFPSYCVSEYGDVVCVKRNALMKGFVDYDGYRSFKLTGSDGVKRQVSAHRLVAFTFLPPPTREQSQIRHKDGSKMHCHYTNLAWCDAAKNREDTVSHSTSATRGERNPKSKLSDADIKAIRAAHRDIKEGRIEMKVGELADSYGVHIATICNIASGKSWSHIPFERTLS